MGRVAKDVIKAFEEDNLAYWLKLKAKEEKTNRKKDITGEDKSRQRQMANSLTKTPAEEDKSSDKANSPTKPPAVPIILKLVRDPAIENIKYGEYPQSITFRQNNPQNPMLPPITYTLTSEPLDIDKGKGFEVKVWQGNSKIMS